MDRITVRRQRPRNPLVAGCLFRKAGAHRRSRASLRQDAERALHRELGARQRETHTP